MKVVVFSHDADTRARVRLAIGRRPASDVPDAEIIDVATEPALWRLLDAGGADVMVLDGESQQAGGRRAAGATQTAGGRTVRAGRQEGWSNAASQRMRSTTARRSC